MVTQRCPRLRHALLERLPTPVRDHVPDAHLGVEQHPLQSLLNDRPQSPTSVPCSSALYQHLQLDGELEPKYHATMKQVEP